MVKYFCFGFVCFRTLRLPSCLWEGSLCPASNNQGVRGWGGVVLRLDFSWETPCTRILPSCRRKKKDTWKQDLPKWCIRLATAGSSWRAENFSRLKSWIEKDMRSRLTFEREHISRLLGFCRTTPGKRMTNPQTSRAIRF